MAERYRCFRTSLLPGWFYFKDIILNLATHMTKLWAISIVLRYALYLNILQNLFTYNGYSYSMRFRNILSHFLCSMLCFSCYFLYTIFLAIFAVVLFNYDRSLHYLHLLLLYAFTLAVSLVVWSKSGPRYRFYVCITYTCLCIYFYVYIFCFV